MSIRHEETSLLYKMLGFGWTITIILIVLKLTNVIQRGWLYVFGPVILPITLICSLYCCGTFLIGIIVSVSIVNNRKDQFPREPKEDEDDFDDDEDDDD